MSFDVISNILANSSSGALYNVEMACTLASKCCSQSKRNISSLTILEDKVLICLKSKVSGYQVQGPKEVFSFSLQNGKFIFFSKRYIYFELVGF